MMQNKKGFTLIEILIALFIFSILSIMLVSSLRTVINAQSGTESKAERLRNLQIILLVMSRDIEQVVNRPVMNANGKEEAAFAGTREGFQCTHLGYANAPYTKAHSTLQRTGYLWKENFLWRISFPVLDQASETKSETRNLMNVSYAHFEYLDSNGKFHDKWPLEDASFQPLPRGVKVSFTLPQWGEITQFYLIPADANKKKEKAS